MTSVSIYPPQIYLLDQTGSRDRTFRVFHFSISHFSCVFFYLLVSYTMQSVNSFRSELTSSLCTGPLNSTMASSIQSNSPSPPPPDPHEMDRLIATIRQITEDKEELKTQLDSLSRQLGEVNFKVLHLNRLTTFWMFRNGKMGRKTESKWMRSDADTKKNQQRWSVVWSCPKNR